jgi:hypothetical protein
MAAWVFLGVLGFGISFMCDLYCFFTLLECIWKYALSLYRVWVGVFTGFLLQNVLEFLYLNYMSCVTGFKC